MQKQFLYRQQETALRHTPRCCWNCCISSIAMCKHILNAQVSIRSPCCRRWFDCAECHQEQENHELLQSFDMTFACKKCKKCFRKDAREFEESDEYCPHCDNHFVLEALTPKPALKIEGEDARVDSRMLKDERVRQEEQRTIFNVKDAPNRLG
ncbi:zinc finger protein [Blastomyces dermatitidis ATCC 18188]|uniref:Zinc finger protein n=1 Tax=Ajellomyces dermatitidis (strain ATCC 18188 / CBS 674.68) TaxID=653446 RepID=F2T869_AJEDA|nr:zinc finger protein [Blastomyces dermatitidis ATCC 18188]